MQQKMSLKGQMEDELKKEELKVGRGDDGKLHLSPLTFFLHLVTQSRCLLVNVCVFV